VDTGWQFGEDRTSDLEVMRLHILPETRGVKLVFTVGHISIMAALLKGRKHFIKLLEHVVK